MAEDETSLVEDIYPATVVEIVDKFTVAINRGSSHGVREGKNFIIYELSNQPIKDPTNGQILGYLERVKGKGIVVHVQEKMSTIESNEEEQKKTMSRNYARWGGDEEDEIKIEYEKKPFKSPYVGDKAKPI